VLPTRLHTIMLMDNHITKSLYGLNYEYNTSLRVIGAALCVQKGYLQKVGKLGKEKGRLVEKPRIRDMVCDLFHIRHDAYSQMIGGYLHNCKVYQTGGGRGMRLQRRHGSPGQRRCRLQSVILFKAGEFELPKGHCKTSP
jgi:hypothetical protein